MRARLRRPAPRGLEQPGDLRCAAFGFGERHQAVDRLNEAAAVELLLGRLQFVADPLLLRAPLRLDPALFGQPLHFGLQLLEGLRDQRFLRFERRQEVDGGRVLIRAEQAARLPDRLASTPRTRLSGFRFESLERLRLQRHGFRKSRVESQRLVRRRRRLLKATLIEMTCPASAWRRRRRAAARGRPCISSASVRSEPAFGEPGRSPPACSILASAAAAAAIALGLGKPPGLALSSAVRARSSNAFAVGSSASSISTLAIASFVGSDGEASCALANFCDARRRRGFSRSIARRGAPRDGLCLARPAPVRPCLPDNCRLRESA